MGLIDVTNKVISCNMLLKIFRSVRDTYNQLLQLSEKEKQENSLVEEENQRWTFLDKGSECIATVYFLNGDNKRYYDMSELISEYRAQAGSMDMIQLRISLFYQATDANGKKNYYNEKLSLTISQRDIEISVDLGTEKKLQSLYNQVLGAFEGAKPRYDYVVKYRDFFIKLVHNTVLWVFLAVSMVIFLVLAMVDAETFVGMMIGFGFLAVCLVGLFLLGKLFLKLFGNIGLTEEAKQAEERNRKNREKRDAAIMEQYEKFAREYGGYYFTRFGKKVYPYKILQYYNPIMPEKLRTEVNGWHVKNHWDVQSYVKQSEICIGKGVNKAYCRVAVEKRIKIAGIAFLVAIGAFVLTVLISLIFGNVQAVWQDFFH